MKTLRTVKLARSGELNSISKPLRLPNSLSKQMRKARIHLQINKRITRVKRIAVLEEVFRLMMKRKLRESH